MTKLNEQEVVVGIRTLMSTLRYFHSLMDSPKLDTHQKAWADLLREKLSEFHAQAWNEAHSRKEMPIVITKVSLPRETLEAVQEFFKNLNRKE